MHVLVPLFSGGIELICGEYINDDNVIAFCLDLINKIRWILINVLRMMSCSILGLPTGYEPVLTGLSTMSCHLVAVMVGITGLTAYACSVSRTFGSLIMLTQSSFVGDSRVKTVLFVTVLRKRIFRFIDSLLLNCAC